ncbi:exonuclease 1-like protein isoform X1 [Tanacetum coccineum]
MGIAGLKQLLLPYCKTVEVKRFDGSRAGIDGQNWLHQAAFSCCRDLALGRHTLKLQKTPEMVHEVIKFVVSPNEADAQLALMQNNELIDVVISDDSDMVAYGCDKIHGFVDVKRINAELNREKDLHETCTSSKEPKLDIFEVSKGEEERNNTEALKIDMENKKIENLYGLAPKPVSVISNEGLKDLIDLKRPWRLSLLQSGFDPCSERSPPNKLQREEIIKCFAEGSRRKDAKDLG